MQTLGTAKLVPFSPSALDHCSIVSRTRQREQSRKRTELAVLRCQQNVHGMVGRVNVSHFTEGVLGYGMRNGTSGVDHDPFVQALMRGRIELNQCRVRVNNAFEERVECLRNGALSLPPAEAGCKREHAPPLRPCPESALAVSLARRETLL